MTVYGLFAIEKKRYRYNTKFVMKIMRNEIKNKIDSVKFLQKIGVTPYTHCPVHPCHKFWSLPKGTSTAYFGPTQHILSFNL